MTMQFHDASRAACMQRLRRIVGWLWSVVSLLFPGLCSMCVQSVTPAPGSPGPPTEVVSRNLAGVLGVVHTQWLAPGSDGGAPVTRYCVVDQEGWVPVGCVPSTEGPVGSINLTGLVPGTAYLFGVFAANE
jgi:hypothetical protein